MMVNLLLIFSVGAMLVWRHWGFSPISPNFDPFVTNGVISSDSFQILMGGVQLFNNISTFSLLSFLDHMLSENSISPVPHLFLLPLFSVAGVKPEALKLLQIFCYSLQVIFMGIWLFEMKKEGIFLNSKAIGSSCMYFLLGAVSEAALFRQSLRGIVYLTLLTITALYYFRLRSFRDHHVDERRQVNVVRSLSLGIFFIFLTDLKLGLVSALAFFVLEVQRFAVSERQKLSKSLRLIFGIKKLPVLSILVYLMVGITVTVCIFQELLPLSFFQSVYLTFSVFFIRCFILYRDSFLELIHISWVYRQVIHFLIFPLAVWLIYPSPNRFERFFQRPNVIEMENISLADSFPIEEFLLPVLADDRRIKVLGMSRLDPRCRLLDFKLKRKFPDWSRNPEADICPEALEKVDAKALERDFQRVNMRTLVLFHPPHTSVPFEAQLFLRMTKTSYEKLVVPIKTWGIVATIFYLAETEP